MTSSTHEMPVVSGTTAIPVIPSGSFKVVSRYVNFFESETTFAAEGQNVGFDRRVRVPLGQLYVFPDGVIDNLGHNEVYFGGEIVYISKDKRDRNRKIYKLNQYGAQYVVSGQRTLPGISIAETDVATAQMKLTIEIHNPRLLLEMYPDRKNGALQDIIDGVINNNVRDDVWSARSSEYLRNFIDAINPLLDGNGVRVVVSNVALTRTMPRQVDDIVKECRLAEHRLIDVMDGGRFENQFDITLNAKRIETLGAVPAHACLNRGDITEFVNSVTMNQSAQGLAFFKLVMHKARSKDTDLEEVKKFVTMYSGAHMYHFIEEAIKILESGAGVADLEFSIAVLRSSF